VVYAISQNGEKFREFFGLIFQKSAFALLAAFLLLN
jgi:hypothetical protein